MDRDDLDDLLLRLLEALTEESLPAAFQRGAEIMARAARADLAAFLLVRGNRISAEYWHSPDPAWSERIAPAFRAEVQKLAARGAPPGATPAFKADDGTNLRVFVPSPREELLRGFLCMAWRGAEAVAGPFPERIARTLLLFESQLATHQREAQFETQRDKYERWFKTLDQHIRLLDRERQKFAAIVNQSDLYVCVTDLAGMIQWTNKAMASDLSPAGAKADWAGQTCRALCTLLGASRDSTACAQCPVTQTAQRNQASHHEYHQATPQSIRNFYVTALPIRGPDGQPSEVMVLIQDLTDLRVVRKSESRYRLLFERSANAIVMVEPRSFRIVLANAEAGRLLGYPEDELLQFLLPELHSTPEWRRLEPRYSSAYAEDRREGFECLLRERGGAERHVVATVTRFDLEGEGVLMLEFLDMTARKRAEDALHIREEQLRQSQKIEAVGRLAGGVAHDFNNLLSVIMGRSELLQNRLPEDDPLRQDVEQIRAASLRGARLTRQLLAMSRQEMAPQIIDLHAVIVEMEDMIRSVVGETIEVSRVPPPAVARIRADRGQIEQALMNLVLNAREAMPAGGHLTVELEIVEMDEAKARELALATTGTYVVLSVRDTGAGMDEEVRAHLFEPFFTTKERSKGAGLGLSIVYGIATRSGGQVEVQSRIGRGTNVRVYLPRVAGAADSALPRVSAPGAMRCEETILLVEDDDAVRAVMREALELEGYSVLEASGGQQALELVEDYRDRIHLLVSDVIMPQMRGGELAQRLTLVRPETKVLFISGYSNDLPVRQAVQAAGAAFLQKPFELDELSSTVREILGGPGAG